MWKIQYYSSEEGFKVLREITKDQFLEIKSFKEYIIFYSQFIELFEILRLNISEILFYMLTLSENHRLSRIVDHDDFADPILKINQKLANVLSSFRFFDDHIQHKLSKMFGKDSIRLMQYQKKSSELFDSYLSYRFFIKLRNYVQHVGLPIKGISFNSKLIDTEKKLISYSVNFNMQKNDLLEYDGWGPVKNDITLMKDVIYINEFINEFYYSILKLYKTTRDNLFDKYFKGKRLLMNVYHECLIDSKEPMENYSDLSMIVQVTSDDSIESAETIFIPADLIKRTDKLYFKHDVNEETLLNSYSNLL